MFQHDSVMFGCITWNSGRRWLARWRQIQARWPAGGGSARPRPLAIRRRPPGSLISLLFVSSHRWWWWIICITPPPKGCLTVTWIPPSRHLREATRGAPPLCRQASHHCFCRPPPPSAAAANGSSTQPASPHSPPLPFFSPPSPYLPPPPSLPSTTSLEVVSSGRRRLRALPVPPLPFSRCGGCLHLAPPPSPG